LRIANSVEVPLPLKPQDVLVLLKLAVGGRGASYQKLANELFMSSSEVHEALKRAVKSQLVTKIGSEMRLVRPALIEFLVHGIRYVFPAECGGLTRGMPTASAVEPLLQQLVGGSELPPVWPDPEGAVQGLAFSPLYRSVPQAARSDAALYELLALVDAVRGGDARERQLAQKELEERLSTANG